MGNFQAVFGGGKPVIGMVHLGALPGSPLYHTARENGWDLPRTFEGFAFLSYESSPMRTKYLSASEVLRFRDDAWQTFWVYFDNTTSPNLGSGLTMRFSAL